MSMSEFTDEIQRPNRVYLFKMYLPQNACPSPLLEWFIADLLRTSEDAIDIASERSEPNSDEVVVLNGFAECDVCNVIISDIGDFYHFILFSSKAVFPPYLVSTVNPVDRYYLDPVFQVTNTEAIDYLLFRYDLALPP